MPGIGLAQGAAVDEHRSVGSWLVAAGVRLSRMPLAPRARYLLGVLALAAAYRGAAQVGYALEFAGPVAAIVWLPAGVGIAFLYFGGLQYVPGVVLGDLLANEYGTVPFGSALGQTTGNVLEIVVAAALLRRLAPREGPLESVAGVGGMLVAIVAGTAVSATVGTISLALGGVITSGDAAQVWRTWWLGDASGALLVVPLALAWARPPPRAWWRRRGAELALVLVAVVVISELALRADGPLTYLLFPAMIWAALRLGPRGATVTIAVVAGFAIWETTHHHGPFAFESITASVLGTQLFLAVSALSALLLAAAVAEREAVAARLAASRARLVEAADTERRRIEHNLHDGAQQRLTALVVRLRLAAAQARSDPERTAERLEDAEQELLTAIEELRELAHGIHPSALTSVGLAKAIEAVAAGSAIPIRLRGLPRTSVDAGAEAAAYFVFSEAVTNARKHAGSCAMEVRAAVARSTLRIEVSDDGRGGAIEAPGSGLEGLRDRVEAIGGSFTLDSPPGRGTRIVATMPATGAKS